MKIRTGVFEDSYSYETKLDWPKDSFAQAGGGHLDGIGKNIFFECFLKDYHVRGEGATLEEAEQKAWDLYTKYSNCNHSFQRLSEDSEIGVCKKCNMKKQDIFEILAVCSCCNKSGAAHYLNKNKYCYEHYKKELEKLITEDKKEEGLDSEYVFGTTIDISTLKRRMLALNKLEELNVIKKEMKDSKIFKLETEMYSGFFEYLIKMCEIFYNKHKSSNYKRHFVDIYEDIENNKEMYVLMYELHLIVNKGIKSLKKKEDLISLLEDYIRKEVC